MSQQDAAQKPLSTSPGAEQSNAEADGHPKTPYAIAVLLIGVIGAYSVIFKIWDGSDFPETLNNSNYWFLLCLIFLFFGLLASLVRDRRRRLDLVIVVALFSASIFSIGLLIFFDRQTQPSDKVFTVVLFNFTNHTATQNLGASFRDNVQRELESRYHGEVVVLLRDREIKGEKLEEKVSEARKWSSRGSGGHLAAWAELSTDSSGANYVINLHFVGVRRFGAAVNEDEVDPLDKVNESYPETSAAGPAVGERPIAVVVRQVSYLFGLANYCGGNYENALRILSPLGTARSEFFAGRAAFLIGAHSSAKARQSFQEAEAHFLSAIDLDPDGTVLGGMSYACLAVTYSHMVDQSTTNDPKGAAIKAVSAGSKAADIYRTNANMAGYALTTVRVAYLMVTLSDLETSKVAADRDLDNATRILDEAQREIDTKSEDYPEMQNVLGHIWVRRRLYSKAIEAYENALRFISTKRQGHVAATLTYLGGAQTDRAWQTRDQKLYEEGMDNFRRAGEICETVSDDYACYMANIGAGTASFNWADILRAGSPDWTREIERAINAFALSAKFVSKSDQPSLYGRSKQLYAWALIERASTERGDERTRLFKEAVTALTEGIDALNAGGLEADELYEKRAVCYDWLAAETNDDSAKREYSRLAHQDRETAKRSAPKAALKITK